MRLSRLNISGFKSFPDRAELAFDHGVTAIVGPNGCGKSNVVDAITWVLGEQSAKSLRGERMEDVIFNGSDARKPIGTAEVRLKLSHVAQAAMRQGDGDAEPGDPLLDEQPILTRDVEIGRRLYRSGESEYLLDGEICRLKDVHEFLMDSGLGIKGYAVIEQGKIGQILSSRPTERRQLIEEAAGITKYKSRRRSAELKLEAAEQNLTRVDDIIFEVEKQRGVLKRQAAKAKRYKRLREELRRWEQVQFARRYQALSRDIDLAQARFDDARQREVAAAAHVAELETQLETLRVSLTEAEAASTSTREAAHAQELEIGRRQQQIAFETQQVAELGERIQTLDIDARDLEGRIDPARLAIEAQRETAHRAKDALGGAADCVSDAARAYDAALVVVQAAERDADEMRASVMSAATTLSALRQARENAEAVRDRVANERGKLQFEAHELDRESTRLLDDRTQVEAELHRVREALAANGDARIACELRVAAARKEREALTFGLAERRREVATLGARLASLEELDAKRAAFGDAARWLLSEAPAGVQQHGAVADYLAVDRSYERAVDAVLGGLLQHVVVDTAADVTGALSLLGDRDGGRCGFVVLDAAAHAIADAGPEAPAIEGTRPLRSVVHATGPHAAAIDRLLGAALIADSFEIARAAASQTTLPIASLSGEVFHGAWVVEGGMRQSAHGILETRAEIADLRDRIAVADAESRRLADELTAMQQAVVDGEAQLAAAVDEGHRHDKAIVGIESQVARAIHELARISQRADVVATELRRATEEEQAAARRRDEAAEVIVTHEAQQRDAEARLGDVMTQLQSAREASEAQQRLVTDALATEEATLIERTSALESDLVRLEAGLEELTGRVAARRADITRAETRRGEFGVSIRETEARLDDNVRALGALKDELRGLDERLGDLRAQFDVRERDIRGARHGLDAIRADVTQAEVARARAASDLDYLSAACLEAVNLALTDVIAAVALMEQNGELVAPAKRIAAAAAVEDDDADGEETGSGAAEGAASADDVAFSPEDVIGDLRQKIDRLGPVNMMAIEQFDELESRHVFLTTQRKDLLDAIAQTGEAIKRIDKTTKERFEEAFLSINEKFQVTFTTLFGGGRAGLVLIDQENDVESGVDIISQPPGKRLQNIQLLSGGEKALTAMALMFAIFKHRPSPFCLLDEIDAPLDDANIGRFVEMLQSMQSHTQFILITHNRKTMEIADRLYGVTMEEPGVSKLISVQLN